LSPGCPKAEAIGLLSFCPFGAAVERTHEAHESQLHTPIA